MQKVNVVGFVENKGPNTLGAKLQEHEKIDEIKIGVAFIDNAGIHQIPLEDWLKGKCKIKILTRISYDAFTSPIALRKLNNLQKKYGEKIETRIARDMAFHEKVYIFHQKKTTTVYLGSSNLTKHGLFEDGELNVGIVDNNNSSSIIQLLRNFDGFWNNSKRLDDKILALYSKYWEQVKAQSKPPSKHWKKLKKLLKPQGRRKKGRGTDVSRNWYLEVIYGEFTKPQQKKINENLEKKGKSKWNDYFNTTEKRYKKYQNGDMIIRATVIRNKKQSSKKLEVGKVIDTTRLSDFEKKFNGELPYFIRYEKIKNARNINKKQLKQLKKEGVIKKACETALHTINSTKPLSQKQREGVKKIFKI